MKYLLFTGLFLFAAGLSAVEVQGVPRDSNFNNTGGYDGTRIEAQLMVNVKDDTNTIHFIRDNNDPRVVTKTYILKNSDPYQFRDYLRQIVQSKRVGNTSLQQQYPGNTAAPFAATVSTPVPNTPAAQPGYSPRVQLGSNTAVECLKYADGTGLLMVSAEEYRFKVDITDFNFVCIQTFSSRQDVSQVLRYDDEVTTAKTNIQVDRVRIFT